MQHTFHSLHEWTKVMFEKLGWMVLSTHDQNIDRVTNYLKSINKLIESIENKIKITYEQDNITDLKILKEQVIYLQHFANASLTNSKNFRI